MDQNAPPWASVSPSVKQKPGPKELVLKGVPPLFSPSSHPCSPGPYVGALPSLPCAPESPRPPRHPLPLQFGTQLGAALGTENFEALRLGPLFPR